MYDLSTAENFSTIDTRLLKMPDGTIFNSYVDPLGLPELREKLAKIEDTKKENIIIAPGSKYLFRNIVNNAKEILVITPDWPGFFSSIQDLGVKVHEFDTLNTKNIINLNKLTNYLDQNPGIKYVVISSPNNANGYVYLEEEINNIYEVCKEREIYFIVDQAYKGINLDSSAVPEAQLVIKSDLKNLIVLNSATKTFGLQGLRIGWGIIHEKEIQERLESNIKNSLICTSIVTQDLFLQVLEKENVCKTQIKDFKKNLAAIIREVKKRKEFSLQVTPNAGTTVLIKLPEGIDDALFTKRALEQGVRVMAGTRCKAYGHIRITFAPYKEVDYADVFAKLASILNTI